MNSVAKLGQELNHVAGRFRQARLGMGLAACWLVGGVASLLIAYFAPPSQRVPAVGAVVLATALAALVWIILTRRWASDPRWVARRIEAQHPELAALLLAAVEQNASGGLGFLQTKVVDQAIEHSRSCDWSTALPAWRLRSTQTANVAMFVFFLFAVAAPAIPSFRFSDHTSDNLTLASSSEVVVEPGNAEIERGTALLVVARFKGRVPADATLVIEGNEEARAMTRNLEDPTFAGYVRSVDKDLTYHVVFGERRTESYKIRVFDYPALERADAKLVYPSFANMEPKVVPDVRHISAVEGTEATVTFRLNKDVAEAKLVGRDKKEIVLTRVDGAAHDYRFAMTLAESQRFRLQLVDREGRANKLTPELAINVTQNRPPAVTMLQPNNDTRVSPIEELPVKANLKDDFGVVRYGLTYFAPGQDGREVILGKNDKPSVRTQAEFLLEFEVLKTRPDDVVTYYFWAEDLGPDSQPRRTSGDMFFAEVRHFEEIFRQGEQMPGGEQQPKQGKAGGNAARAERLGELQKQIINGTWKLVRREIGKKPTSEFTKDATVLRKAEQDVLKQAQELAEKLADPDSAANLQAALDQIQKAEKNLGEMAEKSSLDALKPALATEQAAYQALMKLRAREFEVIKNNAKKGQQAGQKSGGSRNPSQRQLNQLELANDENRFETQRAAQAQKDKLAQRDQAQKETQEVADRLKELARRQTDLNERLKELKTALDQAKTEKEREEIQRQLKRLSDQQEQVLRDTDELNDRVQASENQDLKAEASKNLEEIRDKIQQASESLEKGKLSQAITEGTRAGRQLNELRDELRKQAANRFNEDVKELRADARQLDETQKQLTKQLDELKSGKPTSLRDNGEQDKTKKSLEAQGKKLDDMLGRMQGIVNEAEVTEPRLAQQLFDTVRNATDQKVPESLKVAEKLTGAGFVSEAAEASRVGEKGIEQLRKGIEKAAETVLGSEIEALRRAQREIEDIANQLEKEIAQANGKKTGGQAGKNQEAKGAGGKQGKADPSQLAKGKGDAKNGDPAVGKGGGKEGKGDPTQAAKGKGGGEPKNGDAANGKGGAQQANNKDGQPGKGQPGGQKGGGLGNLSENLERLLGGNANTGPGGPIRGNEFREWFDRLRGVEDLIEDPKLRADAAVIRDRAREVRDEFKRHSKEPDWTKLQSNVLQPLVELRARIVEEVMRRESPDALVPIDRDPVPPEFAESVRRYYERLGSKK